MPHSPDDVVRSGLCVGCGSCAAAHGQAVMRWDDDGFLKPHGPPDWRSPRFERTCPFSAEAANEDVLAAELFPEAPVRDPRIGRLEAAYVGHAIDPFRQSGSSGGLTSWVASELLASGAVDGVAHVIPTDPGTGRLFDYRIARSPAEIAEGAKSRYYPVELSRVLRRIRAEPGRYAVVGIPCFIKAVQLLRRADPLIGQRITHTLGLFCGHMKSAALVESFALQLGAELSRVRTIDYRLKDERRPANWYRAHLDLENGSTAEQDWWHLADGDWGAGFLQNPACDWCDDVVAEVADVSFGDAWVEPYSSDGRGTNVVIARTPEMRELIERGRAEGRLELEPVDAEFIVATQAAGLRHRRDGLAHRLTWRAARGVPPKRVQPGVEPRLRRRLVYRMRFAVARWSHRMLRLARRLRSPAVYTLWARSMLRLYQALAWSRGPFGRWCDRLLGAEK